MTHDSEKVVSIRVPPPSLQSRVQRKREVLQQWLDHGIPYDKLDSLPNSLTEAREWEDRELRIYAIGSPNSFTTRHAEVGGDVEAIRDLLTKLKAKVKRPRRKSRSVPRNPAINVKDIERAMSALISQWHMAREDARKQRVRAELAEKHRDRAREETRAKEAELRLKEAEITDLRRQLAGGLSVVR
jgi:hypothetical protein